MISNVAGHFKIDRSEVVRLFDEYTSNYDLEDVKVKLKYDHTYRVAELCDQIARSETVSEADVDLAWLLGMLHDIGRFEQVRRYGTFRDALSVNHAALSADVLFKDKLIEQFVPTADESTLRLIERAVRFHNLLALPEYMTERELFFADLLRDADRIDILKVNCETPRTEIYNLPESEFLTSEVTPEVLEDIMKHRNVDRRNSKSGVDFILGHLAFIFTMRFSESIRLLEEQGCLEQVLGFQSENEKTQVILEQVRQEVRGYMRDRLEEAR